MKDIGIVIVTFIRDETLIDCLESIRKFYPDISIYVVDQGKTSHHKEAYMYQNRINYFRVPWDIGLSASRNIGCSLVKEKYIMICDDDFVFTEETKLENWREILDARPKVGIIAGQLISRGMRWNYEYDLELFGGGYILKEMRGIDWHEVNGIPFHFSDLVLNFFLMRKEVWNEIPWDADYKVVHEHVSYFLELKKTKWKVAYTPSVVANHDKKPASEEYENLRSSKKRKKEFWRLYFLKTGYRFGVYMTRAEGGIKVIDLATGELVSQHSIWLEKAYGKLVDISEDAKTAHDVFDEIKKQAEKKVSKIDGTYAELSEEEKLLKKRKDEFWKKRFERKPKGEPHA